MRCSTPAAAQLRALPMLGRRSLHHPQLRLRLDRGRRLQPYAADRAWDADSMDSLMLLATPSHSLGYDGPGDFNMDADGRLSAPRRAPRRAICLHRRLDRAPALVRRRAAGPLLSQQNLGCRHQSGPTLRSNARWRVDARRHARMRSRKRKGKSTVTNPIDLFSFAHQSRSRIYTVPPGRPFLTCLAQAILSGNLPAHRRSCARSNYAPRHHAADADASRHPLAARGFSHRRPRPRDAAAADPAHRRR